MRATLDAVTATTSLHDAVTAVDGLLADLHRLRAECVARARENQRRLGLG